MKLFSLDFRVLMIFNFWFLVMKVLNLDFRIIGVDLVPFLFLNCETIIFICQIEYLFSITGSWLFYNISTLRVTI